MSVWVSARVFHLAHHVLASNGLMFRQIHVRRGLSEVDIRRRVMKAVNLTQSQREYGDDHLPRIRHVALLELEQRDILRPTGRTKFRWDTCLRDIPICRHNSSRIESPARELSVG